MRCHKAKGYISQEMDEHLPPDVTVNLTGHLDSCTDCRQFREDLLLGRRAMSATAPELPDNFEWKLQLKLNQTLQRTAGETAFPWTETDQDKWRWARNFGAAAAIGMAAVLALAVFIGPENDPEQAGQAVSGGETSGVVQSTSTGAGTPTGFPCLSTAPDGADSMVRECSGRLPPEAPPDRAPEDYLTVGGPDMTWRTCAPSSDCGSRTAN